MSLETSWGDRQAAAYGPDGLPVRAEIMRDGQAATLEYGQGKPVRIRNFDGGETAIAYVEAGSMNGDVRVKTIVSPNGLPLNYDYDAQGRVQMVTCGSAFRLEYSYDGQGRLVALKRRRLRWGEVPHVSAPTTRSSGVRCRT